MLLSKSLLTVALSSLAFMAQAHQVWLERDASGPVRVYVGDADSVPDSGDEVAELAPTTVVFNGDRKNAAPLAVKPDHLVATVSGKGDTRLFNDQVWKPWTNKDGTTQGAVFSARAGRTETRAGNDYELVPVAADSNTFTAAFKGKSLADKPVTVVSPQKWTKTFKTDAAGKFTVPAKQKGLYILISSHDVEGEQQVAGQKVQKATFHTTLSYVVR